MDTYTRVRDSNFTSFTSDQPVVGSALLIMNSNNVSVTNCMFKDVSGSNVSPH